MAGKTQESQKTRYLLGGESEAENERIEAEFFTNDDLFQELLTAEDDLIDAYARGELPASERKEFEKRFLKSSDGRERVYFARAFAEASVPAAVTAAAPSVITPAQPGFFALLFAPGSMGKWAFATLALAVFVGFPWLLVDRSRMNQELNALRAEREQLNQQTQELQRAADVEKSKNAETLAQLKTLQEQVAAGANQNTSPQQLPPRRIDNNETVAIDRGPEPPPQEIVAFDVDPGSTRGGGGNTFTVSRNVKSISLRLGLESESSRQDYRAMIETADGRRVKTVDFKVANVPHDRVAVPAIAANDLRAGDYIMFLMGKQADGTFERVASYSFRIVRR